MIFDGLRDLPPFDADLEAAGAPPAVLVWRQAIAGSDALLVASPEYGLSLPGALKNGIDWLIVSGELERKIVAITAAVRHPQRGRLGLKALRDTLIAVSARIVGGEPIVRDATFETAWWPRSSVRSSTRRVPPRFPPTASARRYARSPSFWHGSKRSTAATPTRWRRSTHPTPSTIRSPRRSSRAAKRSRQDVRERVRPSAHGVCIVENIFEDGAWAILEWRDPNGLRGCGFFHVPNGQIVLQRGYWDKLSFLRQQGLPLPKE